MIKQNSVSLELQQIKKIELEMLSTLSLICQKNKLKLYLCGGTALGAIRHKGFIPWDDDIDVCLSRPDYEKLRKVLKDRKNLPSFYKMISFEDGTFKLPLMKMIDTRTKCEYDYLEGEEDSGLWIDILPVDGLPDSQKEIEKIYYKVTILRRLAALGTAKIGSGKTKMKERMKYVIVPIIRKIGSKTFSKKIRDLAVSNNYEKSKKVGIITWGLYGTSEVMDKEEFEKQIDVIFEDQTYKVASCIDEYLHNLYGDYMQLPPENKRKRHDMKVTICKEC